MKRIIPFLVLATLALPATAQAACYADYKAKQDAPLRLHYGVAEIDTPCTAASARDQLATARRQASPAGVRQQLALMWAAPVAMPLSR